MNERDRELANQVTWYADVTFTELARFADLIRADEREACAKVVEDLNEIGHSYGLENRIRARGNT